MKTLSLLFLVCMTANQLYSQKITPEARKALVEIDDKKLDSEMDMGGMKMTYHELISFTIYREANMIGQLALWRRLLGYPALKYD